MAKIKLEKNTADDEDDELSILSTTPAVFKSGAAKSGGRALTITIDLTEDDDEYDVVETSEQRRRICKVEPSDSKCDDTVFFRSFTCEICAGDKPISDSFNVIGCFHLCCTKCISNYVAAKVRGNITSITCPVAGCDGFLEAPHCRTILPKDVFDRWGDALCEALILGEERYNCPYKDCSALLIDDGCANFMTSFECPECRRLFCAACRVAWHAGIQCADFQKLRDRS